ncbi:MAG: GAF domain-containing protein [Pseudolabrys sp.]|nr:GAF domain-containing protein [Pseudolabrys sp.]MDP2294222.1 GAF domain-containing protein [Pseudolabrys sp.]
MRTLTLDVLRRSLEGVMPSVMATCDQAGTPNVSMISQVHYVDRDHVALSYQFFNKTRQNLLATRRASVTIIDPITYARYRLALDYIETRTEGPLFESMKAKLAGIASHAGMTGVFRLLGSEVFRVRSIELIPTITVPEPTPERDLLTEVRRSYAELSGAGELGELLDLALDCLDRRLGIRNSMALMLDPDTQRLYTLASRGYTRSGVGSEVALGEGVIGVAARERTPIRIGHMTSEYCYGTAVRDSARRFGMDEGQTTEIPFPGLTAPSSQIAVPIMGGRRTLGVLFAESEDTMRFGYDDEDALALVAAHLGTLIMLLPPEDVATQPQASELSEAAPNAAVTVRHYPCDDSVFLDHDYLIKGVAGAILWRLVREYAKSSRTDFTTRELRLDRSLRLPEFAENLDARLVLLRKRLDERSACIRIEKCGRGRFRLLIGIRLVLEEITGEPVEPH